MAIIFEQEGRKANWWRIGGIFAIVVFLIGATYYLFFSEAPLIARLDPEVQRVSQISAIKIDAASIKEVTSYYDKNLKIYVAPPARVAAGRPNPFLTY